MRLCVNQDGERMDEIVLGRHEVHSINTLTVIANESYEDFAKKLQTEIAEVLNDRPVKVDKALFIGKTLDNVEIDDDMAQNIIEKLIKNDYVEGGQLTDKFYADKENNSIDLGEAFEGKKRKSLKSLTRSMMQNVLHPKMNAKTTFLCFLMKKSWHEKNSKIFGSILMENTLYGFF